MLVVVEGDPGVEKSWKGLPLLNKPLQKYRLVTYEWQITVSRPDYPGSCLQRGGNHPKPTPSVGNVTHLCL